MTPQYRGPGALADGEMMSPVSLITFKTHRDLTGTDATETTTTYRGLSIKVTVLLPPGPRVSGTTWQQR